MARTLRAAINEAMDVHGEQALWSDGGQSWWLGNYIDAQDAEGEDGERALDAPAYYNGAKAIYPVDADGYIGSVALLTLRDEEVR